MNKKFLYYFFALLSVVGTAAYVYGPTSRVSGGINFGGLLMIPAVLFGIFFAGLGLAQSFKGPSVAVEAVRGNKIINPLYVLGIGTFFILLWYFEIGLPVTEFFTGVFFLLWGIVDIVGK
ncbi:hypothetical protein KGQ34_03185 [Patescibacteria group bacterium]|nr:hypothetical protein [Patescibacteria group bacterium]